MAGLCSCRVECRLHIGVVAFHVAAFFLLHFRIEGSVFEILLCHKDAREVLVFESYPVEGFGDSLAFVFRLAQIVEAFACRLIGERSIALFEIVSFFHLAGTLVPVDAHRLDRGREEVLQSACLYGEVKHIRVGQQAVDEVQMTSVLCIQAHSYGAVGHINRLEIKVAAQNVFGFSFESEVERSVFTVEQY